jgi:hypothetical protein
MLGHYYARGERISFSHLNWVALFDFYAILDGPYQVTFQSFLA